MNGAYKPGGGPRQTLPAFSGPVNAESLIAECTRLQRDNADLLARLDARDDAERDAMMLREEVSRLRSELARAKGPPSIRRRDEPLPRPSPLPQEFTMRAAEPAPASAQRIGTGLFAPGQEPGGGAVQSQSSGGMGLDFGAVSKLSPNELDGLPYGLICIDAQGRVVHYNDTESRLAKLPKERVVGRNFFSEVAPCTRVREFEGEFYELVRNPLKVRVRSFDFVFRFGHSEQHVTIVMTPARQRGLYNMALVRRSVIARDAARG